MTKNERKQDTKEEILSRVFEGYRVGRFDDFGERTPASLFESPGEDEEIDKHNEPYQDQIDKWDQLGIVEQGRLNTKIRRKRDPEHKKKYFYSFISREERQLVKATYTGPYNTPLDIANRIKPGEGFFELPKEIPELATKINRLMPRTESFFRETLGSFGIPMDEVMDSPEYTKIIAPLVRQYFDMLHEYLASHIPEDLNSERERTELEGGMRK